KLEGLDADWKSVSGQDPYVSYSFLEAGKYRLYVKASNNDGVFNEAPIYLDIHVRSNPYNGITLTIAMVLAGGIIIGLLVRNVFRNRNRDIKKKPRPIIMETNEEDRQVIKTLESLMISEKLYLDPELGLNSLAQRFDVTHNHLSMLLNDHIGKNFHDYVNAFRIEEVKERLLDPMYNNLTISSIGGDCGFNSKSAFNRIFKNSTGKTPSEYRRSKFNFPEE